VQLFFNIFFCPKTNFAKTPVNPAKIGPIGWKNIFQIRAHPPA
jgi:hypothetical protein